VALCFFARKDWGPDGSTTAVCPNRGTFPSRRYPILFGIDWRDSREGVPIATKAFYGFAATEIRVVRLEGAGGGVRVTPVRSNVFVRLVAVRPPVTVKAYTADGTLAYEEEVSMPVQG
jgi:hypothetical protein